METLRRDLPEFRRAQALGYSVAGMVCLIVVAMGTGVRQGPDDLAKFGDGKIKCHKGNCNGVGVKSNRGRC
jgi:hypothetical protein